MPSLSVQVFISLGLGLLAGLFFGEMMGVLQPLGDIFIALLQMAVWPYIVVSLISGLGRLTLDQARKLGKYGITFVLLFWGIALLAVLAFVMTFPSWTSAAFFSTSLAETPEPVDFINLYIPRNPFASLGNSVLPAVVVFCVAMGCVLIAVPEEKKKPLLDLLDTLTNVMMGIASLVVKLAPIGVFALVGVAAGTMQVEEFVRLQVYIYTYIAVALLLSLWIVPGLLTVLLPISWREAMGFAQKALITAFATGSLLVALPLVAEAAKEALAKIGTRGGDADSAVDVIVPVNFTLPNMGKLIALAFVPFAGWLTGFQMSASQYPMCLSTGLFSMFSEVIALPFLLDLMRIPADTFQLFVALDVSTGRFGQLLGGVHTYALAVMVGGAAAGMLKVQRAALMRYLGITAVLTVTVLGGLRLFYEFGLPHEYEQAERFRSMELAAQPVNLRVLETLPAGDFVPGTSRLEQIIERGVLRVGYLEDSLPHVFVNSEGDLVGLDVDLATILAREMNVDLEFVKVSFDTMAGDLNAARCDVVMSGLTATPDRAFKFRISEPYMKSTMSFVVRDHLRSKFSNRQKVQNLKAPKIGVLDVDYYVELLRDYLPQAEIIRFKTPEKFFEQKPEDVDALFMSAERGSAWTLIHPEYSVAIPQPDVLAAPVSIAMARDAERLSHFINVWLRLKREDRDLDELYQYWILGRGAEPRQPRWSIIRDVLGWVD
jgi:Na+/H+-dicarboxylate symporter/ABC-type amino acid transport substrate-binding protein